MVKSLCQPRKHQGGHQVIHEFLCIPECPLPLPGRDLLSKLGVQVTFSPEERPTFRVGTPTNLLSLSVTPQDKWRLREPPGDKQGQATEVERRLTQLFPEVWGEDNHPGLARHQAPVIIELKAGTTLVRKHQYPIPKGARIGILPHISRLKQAGILVECQTAWNTPILPVKKEGGQDYRPVQDLRLVSQATVTLHLSVPKPYTLLSLLPPKTRIYTCLDLTEAFSRIRLAPASQPIFAFEWEDPIGGNKQQLTWTHLSQGFKTHQTSLEKPWPQTWSLSSLKGMDVVSCNMWTTCC